MKQSRIRLTLFWLVVLCTCFSFSLARRTSARFQQQTGSSPHDGSRITVWPQVQRVDARGNKIALFPQWKAFSFNIVEAHEKERALLQAATGRYREFTFYDQTVESAESALCDSHVCIKRADIYLNSTFDNVVLDESMNEWYEIAVATGSRGQSEAVTIRAMSVWGALRALETLSQLVVLSGKIDPRRAYYAIQDVKSPFVITDYPRFPWRGLLIDTSRHYLSVRKIKKIIDALSYIKLNVLHWHIVDAQSFPLQVPEYPLLSQKASYAPRAVYTPDQVTDIVNHAYNRGIRVIPEFDMPGHAASWGAAYPEITANCPSYVHNINNIPLTPANPKTFTIVSAVISYAASKFIDNFMHFGADELVMGCWKEDKDITAFMKSKGFTSYDELLGYFESTLQPMYTKHNKTAIMWEEILMSHDQKYIHLPRSTILQAWRVRYSLGNIVKAGYRGLLSAGWYLDKQMPGGKHYLWEDTWIDFYNNDPHDIGNVTEAEKKLVLGGEACMWGEQVDDVNFDSRVFPRILAISERLWSSQNVKQVDAITYSRLERHRCNLVRRGVGAGPVMPSHCDASYPQL